MEAPSPFSPAEQHIKRMRRNRECVTAAFDLKNAGHPAVPLLGESYPESEISKVSPKDDSIMNDG